MELQAQHCADVVLLQPQGRIDHLNAEEFSRALNPHLAGCRAGGCQVLFDLSQLEYVSSAGLRVFMLASKQVSPAGGRMVFAAPQTVVREILHISRFHLLFPIFPSVAEALKALGSAAPAPGAG